MISADDLQIVRNFLQNSTGLLFSPAQLVTVRQAVERDFKHGEEFVVADYISYLETNSSALDDLVAAVTIGETYFLRDPAHFSLIEHDLLKKLAPTHVFRAWCAGCSSGEEPFSLAILLDKLGLIDRASIYATDISTAALAKAEQAQYGEWSFRGLSSGHYLRKYFQKVGARFVLDKKIKEKVTFAQLNLSSHDYPSVARGLWNLDLILCRNVLIYFDQKTIESTARGFYESLAEDGILITGPSDPPLHHYAPFQLVIDNQSSYYRKNNKNSRAPSREFVSSDLNPDTISQAISQVRPQVTRLVLPVKTSPKTKRSATSAAKMPVENEQAQKLLKAHQAFSSGKHAEVIALIGCMTEDLDATMLHCQSLASTSGSQEAIKLLESSLLRFPLSPALNYMLALLQIDAGNLDAAIGALRKTLYLDPSLAVVHFTYGVTLKRKGDIKGAIKSLRNVLDICANSDKTAILELSDGETVGRIFELAKRELKAMDV